MAPKDNHYILGINDVASTRLQLQHLWTQLTCGFLIHPDIPISPQAKIVDIATGTGIWPISISTSLPPSVQIDGFDITASQFPPKDWLPKNVSLNTLDFLSPIPAHLVGQYDIVNIRYFGVNIKNSNYLGVLNNLFALLKPGGFLQWMELDMAGQKTVLHKPDMEVPACNSLVKDTREFLLSRGTSWDWIQNLPESCHEIGMLQVQQLKPELVPALGPMFSANVLSGWEEVSHSLDQHGSSPVLGSGEQFRKKLIEIREEVQAGTAIVADLYVTIGQRPL